MAARCSGRAGLCRDRNGHRQREQRRGGPRPAPSRALPCPQHPSAGSTAGGEPSRAEPCRCALRAHRSRPRSASQLPGTCCCRRPSRHAERPADPRAAAGRAVMGGRHRERHRQWERAAARARARRGQRPAGGSGSAERRCSAGLRPSGRPRRCADAVLGRGAEPAGDLQTRGAGGGQGGRRGRRLLRVLHQPHLRLRRWQRPQVRLWGRGCAAGGKGKGRERKVREGPGRPRRDPPCTEGPRPIPRHKVSEGNSAPEHPGGWRSAAWPSAEAVVKPEDRAVHTRGKLARCRAWRVPTRAPRWVGSVPKLRCLGQGRGCGQSCSVGSQQTMPSLRAQHPSNRGCVAAGEPRLFLTAP